MNTRKLEQDEMMRKEIVIYPIVGIPHLRRLIDNYIGNDTEKWNVGVSDTIHEMKEVCAKYITVGNLNSTNLFCCTTDDLEILQEALPHLQVLYEMNLITQDRLNARYLFIVKKL